MSQIRMYKNPVLIKVKSEKEIDDKEAVQSIKMYLKSDATEALPQKKLDNLKKLQRFLSRSNKLKSDSEGNIIPIAINMFLCNVANLRLN
ncbi:2425_t:CDS:2 [Diversispora eburnea]|uniref:2425_t:CDS:1 n=1 Tax=Diversispora eburnea TaxID=1213867 RepID=A0A9N9G085_9GLOM|nr:2425_t:CDS:2 [Diversispora eburnea]